MGFLRYGMTFCVADENRQPVAERVAGNLSNRLRDLATEHGGVLDTPPAEFLKVTEDARQRPVRCPRQPDREDADPFCGRIGGRTQALKVCPPAGLPVLDRPCQPHTENGDNSCHAS